MRLLLCRSTPRTLFTEMTLLLLTWGTEVSKREFSNPAQCARSVPSERVNCSLPGCNFGVFPFWDMHVRPATEELNVRRCLSLFLVLSRLREWTSCTGPPPLNLTHAFSILESGEQLSPRCALLSCQPFCRHHINLFHIYCTIYRRINGSEMAYNQIPTGRGDGYESV